LARKRIVTLLTDFGESDHFVGTMKGVILGINPDVTLVDISHEVASHDIFEAAYTLAESYSFFPPDTIHTVVVDPGVGTTRRPIVAHTAAHKFVAPDNGVLSLVYEREEQVAVHHITAEHYFLRPVSHTFHGRDVFAPVAGWLSKGIEPDKLGDPITDYVKFISPEVKTVGKDLIIGVVLKVDKFGNIITNLTAADVPQLFAEDPPPFKIIINQQEISRLSTSYSAGKSSELFAVVGSSGHIEVSTNRGSAARMLRAGRGTEVGVRLEHPPTKTP
jgi:S-adenosylmethionine hydrolase